MSNLLLTVLAAVSLLVLLAGAVALNVWLLGRIKRHYRDHPERVPRGKRYARRIAPMAALLLLMLVYFAITNMWLWAVLMLTGFGQFAWMIYRALRDPEYPHPRS